MRFPYTRVNSITPLGQLTTVKVPIVPIDFQEQPSYNCLIDSGAFVSHMPGELGRRIGLIIESGRHFISKGVLGISFTSYIHKIEFKIRNFNCKIDVAFSDDFNFGVGLLGREEFFDLFKIHFYQKENFFELDPY